MEGAKLANLIQEHYDVVNEREEASIQLRINKTQVLELLLKLKITEAVSIDWGYLSQKFLRA